MASSPARAVSDQVPVALPADLPAHLSTSLVADPDDGVWVSLWGADQIARISGDGSDVVTIDLPPGSEPHGLAIDHDGVVWVALESGFVLRMST